MRRAALCALVATLLPYVAPVHAQTSSARPIRFVAMGRSAVQSILPRVSHPADATSTRSFFNAGSEVIGSTPHAFALVIKSELANWGKIIKDGDIKAD